MRFLNHLHEKKFNEFKKGLAKKYQADREHLSVLYLMSGNAEVERKMSSYYDGKEGRFQYHKLIIEQDLTPSTRTLVDLAYALYKNEGTLEISDLNGLDSKTLRLVLNAIEFRYMPRTLLYQVPDGYDIIR